MVVQKNNSAFRSGRYGSCTFSLVLDKRHPKKDKNTYPIAMRYTINRKSWYNFVEGEYTEEDFSKIYNLNSKSARSEFYDKKVEFDKIFEKYKETVERLGQHLSLDQIKTVVTGRSTEGGTSFISIWKDKIRQLSETGHYTTGESYECALKSFEKVLWKEPVEGFHINKEIIQKWSDGMKNGVQDKDGNLVGKIADTTRGIYLRAIRVIWNECLKMGYLTNVEYPFSNKQDSGLVAIPRSATRKERYLTVEQMTELFKLFESKAYPKSWTEYYKEKAHLSLGLFLVQYLCNGFNLADAGQLKYTDYYFQTKGMAFKFDRKKTAGRSLNGAEVIIPIIEPLQKILDEIAAKPSKNGYVFPWILQGATDDKEVRRRTSQENSNVQDRIIKICKEALNWDIRPSGTWCRHSFATNLRNAGVDIQYISESMGHSNSDHSVTELYIEHYPLDKQMEYNNKLLKLEKEPTKEDIENMSKKEMQELLSKLLG